MTSKLILKGRSIAVLFITVCPVLAQHSKRVHQMNEINAYAFRRKIPSNSLEWTHVLAFFFSIISFCRYTLCVSVFLCCCCLCCFSCVPALCDPVDYSSSVHAILQARILEWVPSSFCRGSSWPRDRTCISCVFSTAGRFFPTEPVGKP